jgi:hypothetical protein
MNPVDVMNIKNPNRMDNVFSWYMAAIASALRFGDIGGTMSATMNPSKPVTANPIAPHAQTI